jgi:transposase
MGGTTLFGDGFEVVEEKKSCKRAATGAPRVKKPDRHQSFWRPQIIDQLIPIEHRARAIVAMVGRLDLSEFYAAIKSRGEEPGRPATDPAMLIALWLFAISEGLGNGRQLERLCERDDAYRWICGGVQVNYHTLTDFRVDHRKALDELFTQVLGVLMHAGTIKLRRVSQDGVRVRAHAGAASFQGRRGLRKCLAAAKEQVKRTRQLLDKDDPTRTDKQRRAAARAAHEQEASVEKALKTLKEVQAEAKTEKQAKKARISPTDPEARRMRMSDNGFRPAYNVQFAVDTDSRVIVGVGVTNSGSDANQINPMLREVERRVGRVPKQWLVDGGYVNLEEIEAAGRAGVEVLAPLPTRKNTANVDPHQPKKGDREHVIAWRKRMGTEEAKETYKLRGSTVECVNADLRAHRGLQKIPIRGIEKALTFSIWTALTYNVLAWIAASPPGL